jgi:hypothetical protein
MKTCNTHRIATANTRKMRSFHTLRITGYPCDSLARSYGSAVI